MKIAFYGSSLLSSYWNGAATYYRGLLRALAGRGHEILFLEPDAFDRQAHRDIEPPDWAEVLVYRPDEAGLRQALARMAGSQVVVKASGVGVLDDELLSAVALGAPEGALRIFWDVDAPATLAALRRGEEALLGRLLPRFDLVLTYGGGPPVIAAYHGFGARRCRPIYNALDPESHFPVAADPRFAADLAFLGNRLPDRETRVESFFLAPARALPGQRFLLGGAGWDDKTLPPNVGWLGHVYARDHNAFNATPRAVLNIARDSMAEVGFSPATRVFEAAGAGACIITDAWEGIEQFLAPDEEILVAHDGEEVAALLAELSPERAAEIGAAGRRRVLRDHTYAARAAEVERLLEQTLARQEEKQTA